MSCCGGNCGCGSNCQCNSGCTGCKMYPDLAEDKFNATETAVLGVAPIRGGIEGFEMGMTSENDCKCGPECNCSPCSCQN